MISIHFIYFNLKFYELTYFLFILNFYASDLSMKTLQYFKRKTFEKQNDLNINVIWCEFTVKSSISIGQTKVVFYAENKIGIWYLIKQKDKNTTCKYSQARHRYSA